MDAKQEVTDPRFTAELLILRVHEEQKKGNSRKAQELFSDAIEIVGEDEAELIAWECIVELPDEEPARAPIHAKHDGLARLAWH